MKLGRPFEPGNKLGRGRPRGSRNKKTRIAQELLDSHAELLMRKAMVLALKGDSQLLRFLLGYILPRPKDEPVKTGSLPMDSIHDLAQVFALILKKISAGQFTFSQGRELAALIESRRKLFETQEIDTRLRFLEDKASSTPPDQ